MNYLKNIILKAYRCRRFSLLLILLVSIFVSFAFLFFLGSTGPAEHAIPGTDYSNCYKPFADSILQGEGAYLPFNSLGYEETFFVCSPPGYPLFLTIVFGSARLLGMNELSLIVFFNVIVVALSTCLLFLIADLLFNRKVAFISAFLWLSYPFNLWFIKNPNTEVIFIFFFLLGSWLYLSCLKKRQLGFIFFAGVIFGVACLVRPIALFLPIIFILPIFFLAKEEALKKKFLLIFFLILGSLIPILIWEVGLLVITGQFILLGSSGPPSLVDGLTFALRPGSAGDQVVVSNDVMDLMVRAEGGNLDSFSKVGNFLSVELVERPITLAKLLGWKLVRSWYATSQMWWETKLLLVQLVYLLPGIFGLIYLIRKRKKEFAKLIFILINIFYFWLMAVTALSIMRYIVPVMPLIMILVALTIKHLLYQFKLLK